MAAARGSSQPQAAAAAAAAAASPWIFPDAKTGNVTAAEEPLPSDARSLTVGIDGDFLIEQLMTKCHEAGDRYWMFSDAFPSTLPSRLDTALESLAKIFNRIIVVFDGIPPKTVDRTASNAPQAFKSQATWRSALDPRQPLLKQQNAEATTPDLKQCLMTCHEGAFPDAHALGHLKRHISQKKQVEVFTAPSLAWGQLAAFATVRKDPRTGAPQKTEIDIVLAPPEALFWESITEVCVNISTEGKRKVARLAEREDLDFSALPVVCGRQPRQLRRVGAGKPFGPLLNDVPVFDLDSQTVQPLSRLYGRKPPSGNISAFFNDNIVGHHPLSYYIMAFGGIDPTVLTVIASSQFQDQQPILPTADYDFMIQRIMPLRAQIIYQLIQAVSPFFASAHWGLSWERPASMGAPGAAPAAQQSVPICQPPEITLDEWELALSQRDATDRPAPPFPGLVYGSPAGQPLRHTLASVVRVFYDCAVPGDSVSHYDTPHKVLAVTLLKSLDLLGYFTHSAGSTTMEQSTGSIYASALGMLHKFPEEGVLFIELCRTRTLTDIPPTSRDVSGMPSNDQQAVFLALRVLSLLNIQSKVSGDGHQGSVNPFLFAYVSQVRCFQTNLRQLCEVVLHNLMVTPGRIRFGNTPADFNASKVRDVALNLPFGRPLSCTGANVAITIMHYGMLEKSKKPPVQTIMQHIEAQFGIDFRATIAAMKEFWMAAVSALNCLSIETDIRFDSLEQANQMVMGIFSELERAGQAAAAGGR